MDIFELTVLEAIRQQKFDSILSWTRADFYENGSEVCGEVEIEEAISELKTMLHSPSISAEFKFMVFMERYYHYENIRHCMDLLL